VTEYELRVARDEDFDSVNQMVYLAFADDVRPDSIEPARVLWEPDRSHVIIHNGEPVGHTSLFTKDLTVPGAVVPAAHVTGVGVSPLHRRRGLLTRLMHRQLAELTEPIAVLWASEGRIYQRFGYGLASRAMRFEINPREVRLTAAAPAEGKLRAATPETARKDMVSVYERQRADRPGWSSRDERWWDRILADNEHGRRGATSYRVVLYDGPRSTDGYAIWRTKASWDGAGPRGEAHVIELVAATPQAYTGLWQFLLSIDLIRTTMVWFAAVDEPLMYLVNEPRQLNAKIADALWVRIVDLPAALAARRYATPVDVVLEVTDDLLPGNAGRWRLRVGAPGAATCSPCTDEPDIACDVVDLGAAYLGETRLSTLATAGRVRELRPDSLVPVSAAFGWHRSPSVLDIF
jgi:predicted acetyltransferase